MGILGMDSGTRIRQVSLDIKITPSRRRDLVLVSDEMFRVSTYVISSRETTPHCSPLALVVTATDHATLLYAFLK